MRGTSDRLRGDMDEEAQRLARLASGYGMAGGRTLSNSAHAAAVAIHAALAAIDLHQQRERDARAKTGDQI